MLSGKEGCQTYRGSVWKTRRSPLEWEGVTHWPGDHECGLESSRWRIWGNRANLPFCGWSSPTPRGRLNPPLPVLSNCSPQVTCRFYSLVLLDHISHGVFQVSVIECPRQSDQSLSHIRCRELNGPCTSATL